MAIPVYVTNRDRLTAIRPLAGWLAQLPGAEPVILDNGSTYPPLLDWYARECPVPVLLLPGNFGPRACWAAEGFVRPPRSGYYVATDGDLLIHGCPADVLDVLRGGLERYPDVCKVGLNEWWHDMPADHPMRPSVEAYLGPFWQRCRDGFWWEGNIDLTFAMYRGGAPACAYGPALRADYPYVCRQAVWYMDLDHLPEDERYYLDHLDEQFTPGCVWTPMARDRGKS